MNLSATTNERRRITMKRATVLVRAATSVALVLVLGVAPATAAPAAIPLDFQSAVNLALSDAATRLNVPQDQLRVDRVASQEWTDASLGCPQPGQYYAQVVTPGYLVNIAGAGKLLEYHADTNRAVFCRQA
jgi:hypothetical protein